MNDDDARALVLGALATVAPELDASRMDAAASLRSSAELDSMDFLSYVAALSDALDADVPETDYDQVDSINGAVAYVAARS